MRSTVARSSSPASGSASAASPRSGCAAHRWDPDLHAGGVGAEGLGSRHPDSTRRQSSQRLPGGPKATSDTTYVGAHAPHWAPGLRRPYLRSRQAHIVEFRTAFDGTGWDTDHALERAREGSLGLIAEPTGKLRYGGALVLERILCYLHAPAGEVLHRGLVDELGEPRGEGPARQGDFAGKRADRPRPRGVSMDQRERPADLLVLEGAEPAGARGRCGVDPGPDGLDDQDVGKSCDHGLTAGSELPGLGRHQLEDAVHPGGTGPVRGLDADQRRQDPDEVPGDRMVEADRAADQRRRCAALSVAKDLVAVTGVLELQSHDRRRRDTRLASQ